jgi:hypothetical protein
MTTAEPAAGADGYRESAVNRWSMGIPVPVAEQRHPEICPGPEHAGKAFAVRTLRAYPSRSGSVDRHPITWVLSGPNIRQDGTPGKLTLHRKVTRAYAAQEYPDALACLDEALRGLQKLVRSDAEAACGQISKALPASNEEARS